MCVCYGCEFAVESLVHVAAVQRYVFAAYCNSFGYFGIMHVGETCWNALGICHACGTGNHCGCDCRP